MESERRTGRTTAILATALGELLNTGNAILFDHRAESHDALRCLINVFKERLNGFMGFKHDDKYKFVIKGTQVEVTANKNHPFYEKYQDETRYVVAVDKTAEPPLSGSDAYIDTVKSLQECREYICRLPINDETNEIVERARLALEALKGAYPDQVKWDDFKGWNDFSVPPPIDVFVEIMDEHGNIGVGPPIYNHKKWTGVYGECGFSVCQSVNEAITGKIIKWRPIQEKHGKE